MENFKNLPKGTVVVLTEEGRASWGNINEGYMTIDKPYDDGYTCGYAVEELNPNESYLSLDFIKRVVRYPVDTEVLKAGVSVELRDDLQVGRRYAGVPWTHSDRKYFKGEIVKIKGKLDYCGVPAFRVSREDGLTTIISAEMVKQIISEPEVQAEKEAYVEEAKEVTHMKHEDIKVGMKLKLRDDLVEGAKYGGYCWIEKKRCSEYVVSKITVGVGGSCFEIEEGMVWCYTAEMFECEIKEQEVVTGAEALIALGTGKVLQHGDYYYWIKDNELKGSTGQTALPETRIRQDMGYFLKQEFAVLEELPDLTDNNPFTVGGIIVYTKTNTLREVIRLVGADKVDVKRTDGRETRFGAPVSNYRRATLKEQLDYWKAVASHLRQEGGRQEGGC